ncbi:CIA30-domain-containing protein [Lepidopterella palustris CBS 459.81]|uniref:CIA30-domain-containing protein n=1 Tax=Lepidopterella palustris CBS 459.81 TaxID=1314670 RepID=A0A8E2JHF7_9PEZI|nr:CIA30-domain-containing protein [Lepidopterella palustris CBS 459.81]
MTKGELTIFGGTKCWNPSDWTASDDQVRGGKSQSYLDCVSSDSVAHFNGELDIKTLGGAGFASQRTTGEDRLWDLKGYDGIQLDIIKADKKRYTFILKDELLPKNPHNGREQSTVSYEYNFTIDSENSSSERGAFIFIPWKDLKATYRGKEKKDVSALDTKKVKRISIMMRSFFGDQEGAFSLSIQSIKAVSLPSGPEEGLLETSGEEAAGPLSGGILTRPRDTSRWLTLLLAGASAYWLYFVAYKWIMKRACRS